MKSSVNKEAELEEIRPLLTKWMEQGQEGVEEFREVARKALKLGNSEVASQLCAAILAVEVATDFVQAILDTLGPGGLIG